MFACSSNKLSAIAFRLESTNREVEMFFRYGENMYKVQLLPFGGLFREAPPDRSAGHIHPFSMQNVSENLKESQSGRLYHGELIGGDV